MSFTQTVELVGRGVDVAGVAAIAGGVALTAFVATRRLWQREPDVYRLFRQEVGRAILLGLELLVAAGIVLVRTFLSFSLEVELTGRWPWQRGRRGETMEAAGQPSGERPAL